MTLNIWCTGSKGFIGSHLVPELERRGHEVNKSYRADVLVHLEAWANTSGCEADPNQAAHRNVARSVEVIEQALSRGVRTIVFPSTTAIYQQGDLVNPGPQVHHHAYPRSVYAWSKYAVELYLETRLWNLANDVLQTDTMHRIIRLPVVYGPGQRGSNDRGFIAKAFHALLRGERFKVYTGPQRRDWVYVEDVARCLADYADDTRQGGASTVIAATGASHDVEDVARMIVDAWNEATGRALPYDGAWEWVTDVPGYNAPGPSHPHHGRYDPDYPLHTSLKNGLRKTARWWVERVSRETRQPFT